MNPDEFRALVANYLARVRENRAVPGLLSEPALYEPLDRLLNEFLLLAGHRRARAHQQIRTEFGIPDFVIDVGGPIGYVEAKKPSIDLDDLPTRDAKQVEAFRNLPNFVLTNFRHFRLFEDGEPVDEARLGDIRLLDHRKPAQPNLHEVDRLAALLDRFASHRISPPRSVGELAQALARAARVLHDATLTTLKRAPEGALATLLKEWRDMLFHEAKDEDFADGYAQTVTYGLLTARLEMDGRLSVARAVEELQDRHPFLGAALHLLTDPAARDEVGWAVDVVVQVLDGVTLDLFRRGKHADDPLLYFYEDFLAEYDAGLRKRRGVYFTPASVVGFQVRALANQLRDFGRARLLAEDDVIALDPAAGTGTYLLGLLDETVAEVRKLDGDGAVPAKAGKAAANLNGFELLVGPYTVAHQRLATRLAAIGASSAPVRVFLVDTLAEPEESGHGQLRLPFERQLSEERRRADGVKRDEQVMVVVANPPYERAKGRPREDWLQRKMRLFTDPVASSARVNLKNLADSYVHFFRWALWKLFESPPAAGPRLLSFISNRSYLGGDAFEGLRLALRQRFDEIWIVDLEGERRGPMASENIFDQIQVGVVIIVAVRRDAADEKRDEAVVRYARIPGTRDDKERALKGTLEDLEWLPVQRPGGEAFLPRQSPQWLRWVAIDELMPFRQSGVETKRDALVIGVTPQRLIRQLEALADETTTQEQRRKIFNETSARTVPMEFSVAPDRIRSYGYRPLDIRFLYDDDRLIDRPRPKLRKYWYPGQKAFVTLPKGHGKGPAAVLQTELPDRHSFRGSFGGHVFPLWLDERHSEPNLTPGLLRLLRSHVDADVQGDDVFGYVFAVFHAPSYHPRFAWDLAQGFPRIPFTVSRDMFRRTAEAGKKLLAAHEMTAGPRLVKLTGDPGPILDRPTWSETRLRVSPNGFVEPVSAEAWNFAVSGYRVIENWLRKGRTGLDLSKDWELGDQLLRVVDAVESTVRLQPRLDSLLEGIVEGETLSRSALLPLDLAAEAQRFSARDGALEEAAEEAELFAGLSDEALAEEDA